MARRPVRPDPFLARLQASGRTGVVSDALTGACEAAVAFRGASGSAWVFPGGELPSTLPADSVVLAVTVPGSGGSSAGLARRTRRAVQMLREAGCDRHFLHTGPHPSPGLGARLGAVLDELGAPLAVVATAQPAAGAITVGGYALLDGKPVSLEADGAEGHLPSLFAAGGLPTAHLGLRDVLGGAEPVAQAIATAWAAGRRVLVVDAAREADLSAIARAVVLTPYPILPVGGLGLARALQPHRTLEVSPPVAPGLRGTGSGRPVLTIVGSRHPAARAQVERLGLSAARVTLEAEALLLRGEPALEAAFDAARAWLVTGRDVVLLVASATDEGALAGLTRQLGTGGLSLARRQTEALAGIGARLVRSCELSGLLVVGEDTNAALAAQLGATALGVVAPRAPGAVEALAEPLGLRWVVKAGGTGDVDTLDVIASRLRLQDL